MESCDAIKENLRRIADNYDENATLSRGQQGGIIGALDRAFESSILRRRFLAWLFLDDVTQELSTKNLSPAQWYALWKWIDFYEDDGVWHKSMDFLVEIELCAAYIRSVTNA